ncbi:MAG: amidophosphoribosyltransferase [Oscillospiraceae bacterium]|nr:amidophosphoribosyltransferase [Oscillospiraceae bacterium]
MLSREEYLIFGVSINNKYGEDAAEFAYAGLLALQHRGQEGAGIAVLSGNSIVCHKNQGLVSEVFSGEALKCLKSRSAVGNCMYSTHINNTDIVNNVNDITEDVQPVFTEYLTGRIATVHSGNVINAKELKAELMTYGIAFMGTSDSEVISKLIAYHSTKEKSVVNGVKVAAELLKGAFSLVVLSTENNKLIAVRDSSGFRPLCMGKNERGIAVASESCALDTNGFGFVRDIKPGEIVVAEDGKITYEEVVLTPKIKNAGVCIFEYVYLARPDSFIDSLGVYDAKVNLGKILAEENPAEADIVCAVPESGIEAAIGYSQESGLPLITGLIRNRYVGRSFIYPTQTQRENIVKVKFNAMKSNIAGKRIVLVDDSIVRGTSMKIIVGMMKNAGAKEVHLRISSPPVKYTCHFGVDTKSEDVIANKMKLDEICKEIGADSLGYISLDGLKKACGKCSLPLCVRCFENNGEM